jgi:hypothetical protein
MDYKGLGANPDGSVTKTVNADLSDVKHIIENVSYGREQKTIQGNLKIRDEYDDFALYLNDTSGYYVPYTAYSYTMARNGEDLKTGKIKLIQNNIESKELTFNLYDEIYDKYQEIYSKWETDLNIFTYTGGGGGTIVYDENGSITSQQTFRIETTKSTTDVFVQNDQNKVDEYVKTFIDSDDYWQPYKIEFSYTGTADDFDVTIRWAQLRCFGHYEGTDRYPPSGIGWTYDTDISGKPRYKKRPEFISIEFGQNDDAANTIADSIINIEKPASIEYTTAANSLSVIIGAFCSNQFNEGGALSYDISDMEDFVGESLPVGHPAISSSYQNRPYRDIQMFILSDFIPTLAGNQKSTRATVQNLNFKAVSDFLEYLGFRWYLEDAGGTPVLKVSHYSLKSLGSSNPDLSYYKNRNYTYKTRDFKIIENEFDVLLNSFQGAYEFSQKEYRFFEGTKKKEYPLNRIYMNIDHIVDAKDAEFDVASGNNWVAVLTTLSPVDSKYYTRYILKDGSYINNYEGSFYWLARNNFQMPGRVSAEGDEFDQEFTSKRKEITLTVPIDNPQTDFSIYDYIDYFGVNAEIQRIEMSTLDREGQITIKFH